MSVRRSGWIAFLFISTAIAGYGQSAVTPPAGTPPASRIAQRQARVRNYGTACWKQAGMTPDMVNQRWKIEDQQKVQIAQACAEGSTSSQQKHDKIEQIHAQTDHAISLLIPSKELAAFNKCQADLESKRPKVAGQKELGPCGGVLPASISADATSAEHHHATVPPSH
jgi:hypothetical protein